MCVLCYFPRYLSFHGQLTTFPSSFRLLSSFASNTLSPHQCSSLSPIRYFGFVLLTTCSMMNNLCFINRWHPRSSAIQSPQFDGETDTRGPPDFRTADSSQSGTRRREVDEDEDEEEDSDAIGGHSAKRRKTVSSSTTLPGVPPRHVLSGMDVSVSILSPKNFSLDFGIFKLLY